MGIKQIGYNIKESFVPFDKRFFRNICVETVVRCNLSCRFCMYREHIVSGVRKVEEMDMGLFRDILLKINDIFIRMDIEKPIVSLVGQGEPLLDGQIMKRIDLVRTLIPDVRINLATNGCFIRDNRWLLDKVDLLHICINKMDAEEYTVFCGNKDFYGLIDDIKDFLGHKKDDSCFIWLTVENTEQDILLAQDVFKDYLSGSVVVAPVDFIPFNGKWKTHGFIGHRCKHMALQINICGDFFVCCGGSYQIPHSVYPSYPVMPLRIGCYKDDIDELYGNLLDVVQSQESFRHEVCIRCPNY